MARAYARPQRGGYLLPRALPLDYKNREYQRHLTRQEVAALRRRVLEVRTTYFKLATPTDTAYVEHRFAKLHENEEAQKRFYSFDAAGKRLVPAGWKPTR